MAWDSGRVGKDTTSPGADGNGYGIFVQRLDGDGVRLFR